MHRQRRAEQRRLTAVKRGAADAAADADANANADADGDADGGVDEKAVRDAEDKQMEHAKKVGTHHTSYITRHTSHVI